MFDSREQLEKIREGIELYYWPVILRRGLEVHLFDEDKELPPPNPIARAELAPYIAAYGRACALLDGEEVPASEIEWNELVTRYHDRLGALALTAVPDSDPSSAAESGSGDDERLIDTVALMRSPRMVVCYQPPTQRARDNHFVGVFVSSENFNSELARSEPVAHNAWDPNADELTAEARTRIAFLHKEIRRQVAEFLRHSARRRSNKATAVRCLTAN